MAISTITAPRTTSIEIRRAVFVAAAGVCARTAAGPGIDIIDVIDVIDDVDVLESVTAMRAASSSSCLAGNGEYANGACADANGRPRQSNVAIVARYPTPR
jgi:hypothetical protein